PLFNHSYLDWLHPDGERMVALLNEVGRLREKFLEGMSLCSLAYEAPAGLFSTAFVVKGKLLVMAANPNREEQTISWNRENLRSCLSSPIQEYKEILFCLSRFWQPGVCEPDYPGFKEENNLVQVLLKPEEVILFTYG
ncbi:MAG: hypothetical protein ACE5GM_08620, partial [bacterium]